MVVAELAARTVAADAQPKTAITTSQTIVDLGMMRCLSGDRFAFGLAGFTQPSKLTAGQNAMRSAESVSEDRLTALCSEPSAPPGSGAFAASPRSLGELGQKGRLNNLWIRMPDAEYRGPPPFIITQGGVIGTIGSGGGPGLPDPGLGSAGGGLGPRIPT